MFMRRVLPGLAALGLVLSGCDGSTGSDSDATFAAAPVLAGVVDSVIVPTYQELATSSAALKTACAAIVADGATPAEIAAAKIAWAAARKPWERSEAFLFGPVDQDGIDPSLDSWPVDTVGVQAILEGTDSITTTLLVGQDGTVKGFHTIERILWGSEPITGRRAQYLEAAAGALVLDANRLVTAWTTTTAARFKAAGSDGNPWVSPSAAMQELANAMVGIADEVGSGKIGGPVEENNPLLEESRFSGNSLQDFQDNILGIRDVYLGSRGGTARDGFRLAVIKLDPGADSLVRAATDSAVASIGAIGTSFAMGLADNPAGVRLAAARCLALKDLLEAKLLPLAGKVR
jgi:uncharacterized iron-regulated protein